MGSNFPRLFGFSQEGFPTTERTIGYEQNKPKILSVVDPQSHGVVIGDLRLRKFLQSCLVSTM